MSSSLLLAGIFVLVLLASGMGMAYFVGRKSGLSSIDRMPVAQPALPEPLVRELERCLELADYVARDADALTGVAGTQTVPLSRQVSTAVQQLIKTARTLSGRLHRLGAEAALSAPPCDVMPLTTTPGWSALDQTPEVSQEVAGDAGAAIANPINDIEEAANPFDDVRQYPRASFRGTAKATIYPRDTMPGIEPVHCTVLTRDLSCSGIGIAHSEPLYPQQVIVLDAVGKQLVGEVRWCRRVDDHFYVAGCRLVKSSN